MDTDNCFYLLVIHQGVVTIMCPVFPPTMGIKEFDWQNKHWIAPLKCAVLLVLALLSLIPKPSQLFNVAYRKDGIQCHVIIVSSPGPPISTVLDVLHH